MSGFDLEASVITAAHAGACRAAPDLPIIASINFVFIAGARSAIVLPNIESVKRINALVTD